MGDPTSIGNTADHDVLPFIEMDGGHPLFPGNHAIGAAAALYPCRKSGVISGHRCREVFRGLAVRQLDELKLMEVFSLVNQLHADPSRWNLIRASERIIARNIDGIAVCNRACEWQCRRLRCDKPRCRSSVKKQGKQANNDESDQPWLLSVFAVPIP